MKYFATRNLLDPRISPSVPWEYKPESMPSAQIRGDKEARQEWYQSTSTNWNFYTMLEGANPNQRVGKNNPIRLIHGISADYDIKMPISRIYEGIADMKHKPQHIEISLGGNSRLVWEFPFPVLMDDEGLARYFLGEIKKLLRLDLLPGLDEGALTEPSRLLCNGANWTHTDMPKISEAALQAFLVQCGKKHRFTSGDGVEIPLDVVERHIKEKHANFSWPGPFEEGSQGPSFWIEGSQSPLSAIVKKEGMFTFSAHAEKTFYPWADVIGADVVKEFSDGAIARATQDIWWDGKHFWRRKNGRYASCEMAEILNYFKVSCRLSSKPDKTGVSPCDIALSHIWNQNTIIGAASFVFRPYGILNHPISGKRVLNLYENRVIRPADVGDSPVVWGDERAKFLFAFYESLFDPPEQLYFFLAWWKYYYESGLNETPLPGQVVWLMGDAGIGKTFCSRGIVAKSVGGFVDASDHLTRSSSFDSDMYEVPQWCSDDETMAESSQSQTNFQAMCKKVTANADFKAKKKYAVDTMTIWCGRVVCTANLDYVSTRALGSLDNTSQDKISIFRCARKSDFVWPNRLELPAIVDRELPYFLSWLVNWTPPEHIKRDSRFGYYRYHEPTLLQQAYQSSKTAMFRELLVEMLIMYFDANPEKMEWRGTSSQLMRDLHATRMNDQIMRALKLDQAQRYLELMQRERMLDITTEQGDYGVLLWVFKRFTPVKPKPTLPDIPPQDGGANPQNPFVK